MPNKILIVDDEEYTCWFLSKILREEEFDDVQAANTGKEALEKIPHYLPDLVILDLRLPDMHGIEVLRTIRGSSLKSKVIILTAFGSSEIEAEARQLGINNFFSKPYVLEDLLKAIKSALGIIDP